MSKDKNVALGPGADGDVESTVVTPEAPVEPAPADNKSDDSKEK